MQRGDKVLSYALSLIEAALKGVHMSSLYQSMVAVIEQSITPLAREARPAKVCDCHPRRLYRRAAVYDHRLVLLVFIFPPFSADTTNSFAALADFSPDLSRTAMLPFNLSMGVMTFLHLGGDRGRARASV